MAQLTIVEVNSRCCVVITAPAVPDIPRVEKIKALGVTLSRRFSVSQHVDQLLVSCSQSLFALRTLRHHGLLTGALHAVFQATVVSKLAYASPAWWGFTSAADRLEAFLRRSATLGYRSTTAPTLKWLIFGVISGWRKCRIFISGIDDRLVCALYVT